MFGLIVFFVSLIPSIIFFSFLFIAFALLALRLHAKHMKQVCEKLFNKSDKTIGFFHPFCNSGGGGERVLWSAIKALQDTYPNVICVIYTGDTDVSLAEIAAKVEARFTIKIDATRVRLVYLKSRCLVLDKNYPFLTLLGQSIGSMVVAVEAMTKFVPDIYFETTGYAFSYPIFKYLANVPVCCYVHYPTISVDMLDNISRRNFAFNNRQIIARSQFLTALKLYYYKAFAKLYSLCGRCACCVMVNSSWTLAHINSLWSMNFKTKVVYPPCDVDSFSSIENPKRDESFLIASVAQFRPEKNHQLQVKSFAKFLQKIGEQKSINTKLLLIGSCRNSEDEGRVAELRKLCQNLGIENKVEFKLNLSFGDLKNSLADSVVGLHSMKDEHFGIGVVECMAAGTLTIAHNSAGPKEDIVVPFKGEKTGFLAETEDEYCDSMLYIYNLSTAQRNAIRKAAREHVKKFSQKEFNLQFLEAFNANCFNEFT